MRLPAVRRRWSAEVRDPANRLFDSACDLLIASRALAAQLTGPGRDEALAATFGCLEVSLLELGRAHADLRDEMLAGTTLGNDDLVPLTDALDQMARGLAETEHACSAAREAVATLQSRRPRNRSNGAS